MKSDMRDIWSKVLQDVNSNQWCSICFPVEPLQIIDENLDALLSILANGIPKTLTHSVELLLCMWEKDESLETQIYERCQYLLKDKKYCPINLHLPDPKDIQDTDKGTTYIYKYKCKYLVYFMT